MLSELANYQTRIEDLHRQITGLIAGLPTRALNWRPLEGNGDHATNSLAALAIHIAGAEHYWIAEAIGGRPATRDREAEFATVAADITEVIQRLEKTAEETKDVLRALGGTDLNETRMVGDRIVPVRWSILHVIDHTALHLGHMQITYQLWSSGRSMPSPLWFERVPPNEDF
jgi:uncharacterized damage-inducible protein DinB